MPIHGSQASPGLAEKTIMRIGTFTADSVIPINELCQELVVTELGHQWATFTGTSGDLSLKQSATLQNDTSDPAATMTTVKAPGSAYQLTAGGTSIYRPNGGILVNTLYKESINSKQIIQIQAFMDLVVTTVTGVYWIKYYVKS